MHNRFLVILVLIGAFFWGGCGTWHSKDLSDPKKEALELKKKRYTALSSALSDKSIRTGMTASQIKETYGDPDSIFNSGSTNGSFEIWTYEDFSNQEKFEDWHPIRLYFDNAKLIDWRY